MVVRRRVKMSVRGLNRSVVVRRKVRGLHKGSEERSEVLKEGVVGVGVRGSKVGVKGRRFRTGLYSRLLYFR